MKINTLNYKCKKLLMWRFAIYLDFIEKPPKFMVQKDSIYYLHVKYFNRRTIFKLDNTLTRKALQQGFKKA